MFECQFSDCYCSDEKVVRCDISIRASIEAGCDM